MMKLIIPLTLLMPLSYKNLVTPPTLFSLFLLSLPMLPPYTTFLSPGLILDKLSTTLITLTLWVTATMLLASQKILISKASPTKLLQLSILLCSILIMAFSTSNLMIFYILFEASLIPTFMIILLWGYQPERLQASTYLILYTVLASFSLLISIMLINTLYSSVFLMAPLPPTMMMNFMTTIQPVWWALTTLPFLVKIPMYSTHLWLPKAHVEAPVAGSMILAAILLKLGAYGLIRMLSMFNQLIISIKFLITPLALIGAVAASLICLQQTDLKALIAYSSVGHMGLLIPSAMSTSTTGWHASLLIMISHGLTSAAMFAMANMTYEMFNTRALFLAKGLMALAPPMALMWFLASATNMAAPPSLNLFSEITTMPAILSLSMSLVLPLVLLTFLSGAYSLLLYSSINHGHPPLSTCPTTPTPMRNFLISTLLISPSLATPLKLSSFLWPASC